MKIAILLLYFFCSHGELHAQSIFEPDSISIEYAPCRGDSAAATVLLINRGSGLEIHDLRFTDSNRSWEIYDSTGGKSIVKGIVLQPGDTIAIQVRHRWQATWPPPLDPWSRDTLVTYGMATSDTLLLNARVQSATLRSDIGNPDIGVVLQGAAAEYAFRVWNEGDVLQLFDGTVGDGWTLEGLARGDTLMPGDTIGVRLVKTNTSELGTFTTNLTLWGDCELMARTLQALVRIVPPHAYWTLMQLTDTISGCPRLGEYQVTIRNDSQTDALIDSVSFILQPGLWSIKDGADRNFILPAGSEKVLTLIRGLGATSTRLVINSRLNGADTLPALITSQVTIPRIRNYRDTVSLMTLPDTPLVTSIDIQNSGPGLYRLTSVQLQGDPRWSVLGLDTVSTAGLGRSLSVTLVFSGASEAVDYPARVSIQGSECDTILRQTIIARVALLDVVEEDARPKVEVYPSIASTTITLRLETEGSYAIYDVLGNEMLRGSTDAVETSVDVSTLPAGRYYIRVTSLHNVTTVPIVVAR